MRNKFILLVGGLIGACALFVFTIKLMGDPAPESKTLRSGDIIFQTSQSGQSKAIQLATGSEYSHRGIIYVEGDQTFVYEAIQPVKSTPLKEWIARGKNQHYVVKRLKNSEEILTTETLNKMKAVGNKFKGKNYDLYFEWSERIYCSELVWKIYFEATGIAIGSLQQLKEFSLTSLEVKQKLKDRYGENIPLHTKVISPESMFNSDLLVTVAAN
jgi:uncharacterized protein YycO